MSERDEALAQIHAAISTRIGCTLEDYVRAARDWVVVPVRSGNAIIGGVLVRHNELHLALSRTPGASNRRVIRDVLERTVKIYGSAITLVYADNPQGLAFCERLGFEVTWRDEATIHMRYAP